MNEPARQVASETLHAPSGMPIFVARPIASGRFPIVVLMHERYGLVQHTRDLAARCAGDGYFVMAPNFFFRHPDPARLNAGDSRYDLSDPEAIELIGEACALASQQAQADATKIAVGGYCQTGRHPLVYAAQAPVQALIVWYGAASKREWEVNALQPRPLADAIASAPCPVFGAFGSDDHIISLDDVRRFRNTLEDKRKSYDIRVYAGAPHGWLNDTMPGRYRKAQAQAAWAAQQAFLKETFAGRRAGEVRWDFQCASAPNYDFSKNVRLE
jgi:carboxymethylenebutenolidase